MGLNHDPPLTPPPIKPKPRLFPPFLECSFSLEDLVRRCSSSFGVRAEEGGGRLLLAVRELGVLDEGLAVALAEEFESGVRGGTAGMDVLRTLRPPALMR